MHPVERLRYVARSGDLPAGMLAREAAAALAAFAHDPTELVTACRQLVEHRPAAGPVAWVAARMLTGVDPVTEARDAAGRLERDPTASEIGHALPADARLLVVGSPELAGSALMRRGDVTTFIVDSLGDGEALSWALRGEDHDVVDVAPEGVAAATDAVDMVVLEAEAVGDDDALTRIGGCAAAAAARRRGLPVWLVVGVGRRLPEPMWQGLRSRAIGDRPWSGSREILPLDLVTSIVGPGGPRAPGELGASTDCPVVPELC